MHRALFAIILVCAAAGCRPSSSSQNEVVVYTALDSVFSEQILDDFSQQTGIQAAPKFDTESTKTVGLTQAIIAEQGETLVLPAAFATTVGANLCTLNLLQGTLFMPSLKDSILFIEDDHESKSHHFDRDLQSLIHLPGFVGVKGILIGRFQRESGMTRELLTQIVRSKPQLAHLPLVANVDFGHTYPMITFPIGGTARFLAKDGKADISILKH
jgi:muramoyltetrapeptide carboxypeptidase LdcA involved in peptidoglycan recycling